MKRMMFLVVLLLIGPELLLAAEAGRGKPATQAPAPQPPPEAAVPEGPGTMSISSADSTQYIPDTTVLARINRRIVRVIDYRDRYFSSEGLTRPAGDSLGRIEFLNNMINKDVMGLTALAINRPLSPSDEKKLRQFTDVAIQNVMHQRLVRDSISISEEDLRAVYPQYSYEQRLRGIAFDNQATAQKVRADLVAGRISWKNAVLRYAKGARREQEGEMGWVTRWSLNGDFALKAFSVAPGGFSEVALDAGLYHVLQCVERRKISPPPYQVMRRYISNDLYSATAAPLMQRMFQSIRAAAGVTYDTTNILWATAQFVEVSKSLSGERRTESIDFRTVVPRFEPADTGRVLARARNRQFTLGQFTGAYESTSGILRRRITGFETFLYTLDGFFLAPDIIAHARAGGFERDSMALAMIEHRREELLVEHLFTDSILNRVTITPAMRRRYYQDHQKEFVSVPRVRYAQLIRHSEAAAESLVARLRAGESPEAIIAGDSLRGGPVGAILEAYDNRPSTLRKVLFEELRPGQVTKVGPDSEGSFMVVKLLTYQESRPMAYEEVESIVAESVQNTEAERLLKEFLARHRRRYRIEVRPELVMQIRLTDPALEVNLN